MDLSVFFEAPSPELIALAEGLRGEQLGSRTGRFPNWQAADLVILGVHWPGLGAMTADAIRRRLYELTLPHEDLALADLGNLKARADEEALMDTLAYVMEQLLDQGKKLLLLSDSPACTLGQYFAYERLQREVRYVHIGATFALLPPDASPAAESYNQRIFLHEPNYLRDFVHLGYQRYFVTQSELSMLRDLNFAALRYGDLIQQMTEAEPYLREADMASFDLSAIRSSDFGAGASPSPGGFSAMEACQLARYAGMSPQLDSFNLSGLQAVRDPHGQSALLAALLLWYFMEGYYHRRPDQNPPEKSSLRRYEVALHGTVKEIVFFQSPSTGRWWMDVPYPEGLGKPRPESRMVPCSEKDYHTAREDHIPDRWWREFHKMGG